MKRFISRPVCGLILIVALVSTAALCLAAGGVVDPAATDGARDRTAPLDTHFTGEDELEEAPLAAGPTRKPQRNPWALILPLACLALLALNVSWRHTRASET